MEVLACSSRSEFREWLSLHHADASECWLALKVGEPKSDGFYYLDAVEEALCFGWIDGVKYKLESVPGMITQRFSPRRKGSYWSELNKERCRRLERLGLMTDAGRAVLPDMGAPFVISEDIARIFKGDALLKRNFESFPVLYQRIRLNSIQRESKKPEVYERMLRNFIAKTRAGIIYGLWTDYGRLYP